MSTVNVVSISGGKDSTALALLAIERKTENLRFVFADTGHEHRLTYEYVEYLDGKLKELCGVGIDRVKADFSKQIDKKKEFVAEKWFGDLTKDKVGKYAPLQKDKFKDSDFDYPAPPNKPPVNQYQTQDITEYWQWRATIHAISEEEARTRVDTALEALSPTGIPFLDLCLWKGRFPSTRRRFCSKELKHAPINKYMQKLWEDGYECIISWQGVRRDESEARKDLLEKDVDLGTWEPKPKGLLIYRPILDWKAADCFAQHEKHGINWNPLYEKGMGRVGCMACIHCTKNETREIARRFPDEINRMADWEIKVSKAAKRGCSIFMDARTVNKHKGLPDILPEHISSITPDSHGIREYVSWASTARGGRQFDLIHAIDAEDIPMCSSQYGLCE